MATHSANYFILFFFLEGAKSGSVKEKENKHREVKKDPEILGYSWSLPVSGEHILSWIYCLHQRSPGAQKSKPTMKTGQIQL